jgi:hypothetical protein
MLSGEDAPRRKHLTRVAEPENGKYGAVTGGSGGIGDLTIGGKL